MNGLPPAIFTDPNRFDGFSRLELSLEIAYGIKHSLSTFNDTTMTIDLDNLIDEINNDLSDVLGKLKKLDFEEFPLGCSTKPFLHENNDKEKKDSDIKKITNTSSNFFQPANQNASFVNLSEHSSIPVMSSS